MSADVFNQDADVKDYVQKQPTAQDIEAWLSSHLAELREIDLEEIDTTIPFNYYGLDSAEVVSLTSDLNKWLGYDEPNN